MADILVACEVSGIVRDAFIRRGHNAVSVDISPSDSAFGPHIQGDALEAIHSHNWDMLIAFPPCQHLSVSGARYWADKARDGRQQAALDFVKQIMNAPVNKICIENPVGKISTAIRRPDQIIQPWWFGEDASKKTCLWLTNLPPLMATNIIKKDRYANQTPSGQNKLGPSPDRAKKRAMTYVGVAEAMATQWG
jgi:site-specific DNA-cytosine methylase